MDQLQTTDVIRSNHSDVVRSDEAAADVIVALALPLRHTGHFLQESNLGGRDLHVNSIVNASVQRFFLCGEIERFDHLEVAISRNRHDVGTIGGGENR